MSRQRKQWPQYQKKAINGVIAVPIMVAMIIAASRKHEMGNFVATLSQRILGWTVTAIMAAAAVAMFVLS